MIDEELLNKFDRIQDLPVSEEILGAYIEGNLNDAESILVSNMIDSNPDLSLLSYKVESYTNDALEDSSIIDQGAMFASDFVLPAIETHQSEMTLLTMSDDMEVGALCDSPFIADSFAPDSSDMEDFSYSSEHFLPASDSSETDSQSLDSDSDAQSEGNMLNDNFDF